MEKWKRDKESNFLYALRDGNKHVTAFGQDVMNH
jgi:hypothetical protein